MARVSSEEGPGPAARAAGPMRFSHNNSPVLASSAWMVLAVPHIYITPLWTMGVSSIVPFSGIDHIHFSCS